jgi:penicillin-binding protein 1A
MSRSGNRPPPLVADRRYKTPAGAKKASPQASRKPPKKRAPRRRGISGWIAAFVGLIWRTIWRTIWGIIWRVGAVFALILAAVTFYFYAQLPPVNDLLDARARGSVTLLDRDDKVFAWRRVALPVPFASTCAKGAGRCRATVGRR